jgi:hypothetical protein
MNLQRSTAECIVSLVSGLRDAHVSLRSADSLADVVKCILAQSDDGDSRLVVLRHLVPMAKPEVIEIIVGVALIGDRNASVAELATICRISERRLQERLSDLGLPSAKRLLMWTLLLNALVRVEDYG